MTLLADVLDPVELATAVENGHVRMQRHPSRPFVIYNYTEACQFAGAWTPVTLACRGALFLRLDGKDYRPSLWQQARPEGDRTPGGIKVSDE